MSHQFSATDDEQLYTQKKRNTAQPVPPVAAVVAQHQHQLQQQYPTTELLHLSSIEEEKSRLSIDREGGSAALSSSNNHEAWVVHPLHEEQQQHQPSHFLRPCLRLRDENGQLLRGNSSRDSQSLNLRWHDINGNGELVEVYEYEPRCVCMPWRSSVRSCACIDMFMLLVSLHSYASVKPPSLPPCSVQQ